MKQPGISQTSHPGVATTKAIQAFFDEQAELFANGDVEELAKYCIYPLPFYTDNGIILAKSAEKYQEIIVSYLSRIFAGGLVTFRANLIGIGQEVNGRFPVRLDWEHIAPDGTTTGTSKLRYFLVKRPEGGWLIEIIEYFQFAGPPILNAPAPNKRLN